MNFAEATSSQMERGSKRRSRHGGPRKGAIANPDEKRMVGHYWLRNPNLAPNAELKRNRSTLAAIKEFATRVHGGAIIGSNGISRTCLVIGIGGPRWGREFVSMR